jgi:hypothetical protein
VYCGKEYKGVECIPYVHFIKVSASFGAVGFVDDTTEAINDFTNDSATPSQMVDKAKTDAQ